jgi:hypothetical protein
LPWLLGKSDKNDKKHKMILFADACSKELGELVLLLLLLALFPNNNSTHYANENVTMTTFMISLSD